MVDQVVQLAAPLAKKLFKKIIDRHEIRKNFETKKYLIYKCIYIID